MKELIIKTIVQILKERKKEKYNSLDQESKVVFFKELSHFFEEVNSDTCISM